MGSLRSMKRGNKNVYEEIWTSAWSKNPNTFNVLKTRLTFHLKGHVIFHLNARYSVTEARKTFELCLQKLHTSLSGNKGKHFIPQYIPWRGA